MAEQSELTPGWYATLQEAADAALDEAEDLEMEQAREIVFQGQKKNPIHEFKAKLKPARE
jgi:hypothetical protein